MKYFVYLVLISTSIFAYSQEMLTLICQNSKHPEFQNYVYVDLKNKKVLDNDAFDNYVTDDLITYTFMLNGSKYQTNIYRATGKFTVFVSGENNFSFGGYCQKKTANKF
jgi:hypothetical protein